MAVSRINWGKIMNAVASQPSTQASLSGFRKQYDDLKRQVSVLEEQKVTVDFAQYRKVLANQKVIDQLELTLKKFTPVTYDLSAQQEIIAAFETKALDKAQAFSKQIETEVATLKETKLNIENARPIEELSVEDVAKAIPEIDEKTEDMVKKGEWNVPGLAEKIPPIPFF